MFSLHHITISSRDADVSIKFYERLGFKTVLQWSSVDKELRIVHMKLGAVLLEIFSYAHWQEAPATTKSLDTDLPRVGIKHFGLKVADIKTTRDHMIGAGIATNPEITEGRTGIKYFFINDPDGNWVEIVQDAPKYGACDLYCPLFHRRADPPPRVAEGRAVLIGDIFDAANSFSRKVEAH